MSGMTQSLSTKVLSLPLTSLFRLVGQNLAQGNGSSSYFLYLLKDNNISKKNEELARISGLLQTRLPAALSIRTTTRDKRANSSKWGEGGSIHKW